MALADVVETLRPDWSRRDIERALAADDRPWRTVAVAAILGAADPDTRHPNGLRYVGTLGSSSTPVPPPPEHRRQVVRCIHGAESGLCALCRTGVTA